MSRTRPKRPEKATLAPPVVSEELISRYDAVIATLVASPGSIRCSDMKDFLTSLGYEVVRGTKANHHTYAHSGFSEFYGANFDGGHGRDPCIKRAYVYNVKRQLTLHREQLRRDLDSGGNRK